MAGPPSPRPPKSRPPRSATFASHEKALRKAKKAREQAEENYRDVLQSAIDVGMTYRYVAEVVGQTPGTIHTLLHGRYRDPYVSKYTVK